MKMNNSEKWIIELEMETIVAGGKEELKRMGLI